MADKKHSEKDKTEKEPEKPSYPSTITTKKTAGRSINFVFFIIGVIASIAYGLFAEPFMYPEYRHLIIIIIGLIIGILNIDSTEEPGFLLSSIVFVVSILFLEKFMLDFIVLQNIYFILENFAILTACATAVISVKWVYLFLKN